MIRILLLILCFTAVPCALVRASDAILIEQVNPKDMAKYRDRFAFAMQRVDGFTWFEITVRGSGAPEGIVFVGAGGARYVDNESLVFVEPRMGQGSRVFRFGLSDAKIINSIFELRSGGKRYELILQDFVSAGN